MTLTGGLICYGIFFNRGLGLSVIGYSIAPAERVMQGEVPYRDFLFNYTPGILWVNAALMKVFGATLMTTRIGLFVFKLITLLTLFYIGRRLTSPWIALVPVALCLAWPAYQQFFNVYPDQYLMLVRARRFDLHAQLRRHGICALADALRSYDRRGISLQIQCWRVVAGIGCARLDDERVDRPTRPITIAAKQSRLYALGFAACRRRYWSRIWLTTTRSGRWSVTSCTTRPNTAKRVQLVFPRQLQFYPAAIAANPTHNCGAGADCLLRAAPSHSTGLRL